MEAIRSSETSGTTQRTTRRHIPEDDTPHNYRCGNLKSYMEGICRLLFQGKLTIPSLVWRERIMSGLYPTQHSAAEPPYLVTVGE
jgi:hypothetical protein